MKRLRNSVLKWLVVSLLCLLLGFLLGKFKQDILDEQLSVMNIDLSTMNSRNSRLTEELSRLDALEVVDKQTITSLIQANKQLQDDLSIANNKVFFYERVISPETDISGVKVHSFSVSQNPQTQRWDYELVLMQSQKNRRFLNGQFSLHFSVFEGDVLKEVALDSLSDQVVKDFKFQYFQTIQGSFHLANDVMVDEAILRLNVDGNRWYKAQNIEERYDWRALTSKDLGELSEFDNGEASPVQ